MTLKQSLLDEWCKKLLDLYDLRKVATNDTLCRINGQIEALENCVIDLQKIADAEDGLVHKSPSKASE